MKTLLLVEAYFKISDICQCLDSIDFKKYDVMILENPSKYSVQIYEQIQKYPIRYYFRCNENIEGNIFTLFFKTQQELLNEYKYIGLSEGDVVFESDSPDAIESKDSIGEALEILEKNQSNVRICSVDLNVDMEIYKPLNVKQFIPNFNIIYDKGLQKNIKIGHTGFQCILAEKSIWLDYIDMILKRQLWSPVALGSEVFHGISDSNLIKYANQKKILWARTTVGRLDHIGWRHYLNPEDEYWLEKQKNLREKKIRYNSDLKKYILSKI